MLILIIIGIVTKGIANPSVTILIIVIASGKTGGFVDKINRGS